MTDLTPEALDRLEAFALNVSEMCAGRHVVLEVEDALALIQEVRRLREALVVHQSDGEFCTEDGHIWPCRSNVRAHDGAEALRREPGQVDEHTPDDVLLSPPVVPSPSALTSLKRLAADLLADE